MLSFLFLIQYTLVDHIIHGFNDNNYSDFLISILMVNLDAKMCYGGLKYGRVGIKLVCSKMLNKKGMHL